VATFSDNWSILQPEKFSTDLALMRLVGLSFILSPFLEVSITEAMEADKGTMSEVIDARSIEKDAVVPMDESHFSVPQFAPLKPEVGRGKAEKRKIPVPPNRMTPLKDNWEKIYVPIVQHMKLQIRMNLKTKQIELRTSEHTEDAGAIQKAADFIKAFMLGFEVNDAVALLRLDDLYIDTFEIEDVKTLKGEHLSRAIGRIAGKDGKTKFAIENTTRTRIVLADKYVS